MRGSTATPQRDDEDGGRRPSLRELEVLAAMITDRKTTAAAQSLGISQSAVSRAIASLERRTGHVLFDRDSGRLAPTPAALALHAEAAPIFETMKRLDRWPDGHAMATTLRIVAASTLAHGFLAHILPGFSAAEPDIMFQVEIARSPDVVSAIADRGADVGIVDQTPDHIAVRCEVFRRSLAHVALPRGHRLASANIIQPADLRGEDFIALARRLPARGMIDRALFECGSAPRIVAESATSSFAVELVRRGMGVAILNPFPFCLEEDRDIVFRRFGPAISFETSALQSASAQPNAAARRLIDYIRREQPEDGYSTPLR